MVESVHARTRVILTLSRKVFKRRDNRRYKRSAAQSSNRRMVNDISVDDDFSGAIFVLHAKKYTLTLPSWSTTRKYTVAAYPT